ncbi:MAG: aldehyde dehydrogenase (NADP(+)) [Canibacter sp.]
MAFGTTTDEVDAIVVNSDAAADTWRKTPAATRARSLNAVADALDAAADQLVPIAQEETRLTEARLRGELKRTTFQLRLFSEVITEGSYLDIRVDHADPEWPMGAPRPDLRRTLVPLGPVVVFSASNFPFAFSVAGGDTASALASGCSVIVKAHSGHPKLSEKTAEVVSKGLADSGAPEGLFALILGTQSGRDALSHPLIKAGAFTGSISGGRALFDIAQSRPEPIPFYGELGSVNPVFVTASAARSDDLLQGFVDSFTGGSGQFCTKPGLLVVPRNANVPQRLTTAQVPEAAPLLNDRIQTSYVKTLKELAAIPGVERIVTHDAWLADPPTPSLFSVDIAQVLESPDTLVSEVFGPTALIIEYDEESQMLELCKLLEGQLTISVFANERDEIAPNLLDSASLRAGRVLWNQWPTGVSVTYAQQHGGPYPATTAVGTTSVGTAAINRFVRPVAYQGVPDLLLPSDVQEDNPLGLLRRVNGVIITP